MSLLPTLRPIRHVVLCHFLIIAGLVLSVNAGISQTLITTVAGMAGNPGFSGDGGPATQAQLHNPVGICFDPAGNLYIADWFNHRVRKVDGATGNISTIAGTGVAGFSGDGGPAVNAALNHPFRLLNDHNNHLFIVDYDNLRVRMIDLVTGTITTVAGDGTQNYVNGGQAVNGGILPNSITMDGAGDLYISQHMGPLASFTTNIISKLHMKTGTIVTIAGSGVWGYGGDGGPATSAELFNPDGMAFDAAGNLYFADQSNYRIRRIDAASGIISTVMGGGANLAAPDGVAALSVAMKNPADVLVDGNGNLLVCDENDERVRLVDMKTGLISTIAGMGTVGTGPDCVAPTSEPMNDCDVLAWDVQENLYFSEIQAHRIRKIFTAAAANATIGISTSDNPVCTGALATFTAQVSNGGSGGSFQWKVNGQPAGTNSPTFTSTALHDGDVLSCELSFTSGGTCSASSSALSNNITVQVTPLTSPAINISTPSATICSGGNAVFTATAVAAGASPVYQWLVNGSPVGGNTATYTAAGLADNDIVQCRLTPDPTAKCTSMTPVTSAPLQIRVMAGPSPSIQVSASAQQICPGDTVLFTAAVQNTGSDYSLQWELNGNKVGENKDAYSNAVLHDGDVVICTLIAGSNICMAGQPVTSNQTIISVRKLPVILLGYADTTILPGTRLMLKASIQGNAQTWQWSPASELIDPSSATPLTVPMTQTTDFRLTVFSTEGCPAYKDVLVRVFYKLSMPNSFTPNRDGNNDVFRIPPFVTLQLEEFTIFDRWGSRIFSTKDIAMGWDGTWKGQDCASGVYVYVIKGKTIQGEVLSKGTVILVR